LTSEQESGHVANAVGKKTLLVSNTGSGSPPLPLRSTLNVERRIGRRTDRNPAAQQGQEQR